MNTSFHEAGNWTSCNDRTGIPDILDYIIVATGNTIDITQPVMFPFVGG